MMSVTFAKSDMNISLKISESSDKSFIIECENIDGKIKRKDKESAIQLLTWILDSENPLASFIQIRGINEIADDYKSLTFDSLREANIARLPKFRDSHGRLSHTEADGSDWSDAEWLQAVVGELGEYANIKKKVLRGDITAERAWPLLRDEIADVLIYLDILAFRLNMNLGEAVRHKFNLVSDRVGIDIKI